MRSRAAIALAGVALAGLALAVTIRDRDRAESLRSGEALYASEDFRASHRLALEHIKRRPDDRRALLLAARSLSRMNRADRAEPLFERAGPPFGIEDHHARADGLLSAGRQGEAASIYRLLLAQEPDDVLALRRLAALEIARDNVPEASRLVDRLIGIADGEVIGQTIRGTIAYNGGDFDASAGAFARVLELDPGLRVMPLAPRQLFWGYLSNSLLNLGRSSEARRHLHRALREHPDDAGFMDLLARCYEHEGNLDEAATCWRRAAEWDPDQPSPWLNLGKLALQEGDPAGAVGLLVKAAERAPDAPEPYYSLSLAHRRLGQPDEADRCRRLADRLKDPNAPATP